MKDFLSKRPLSWSAISSFEYSPTQWYRTYMLGEKQWSKELTYGSVIDQRFQDDPTFLPEIPRGEILQYEMRGKHKDIPLIGKPDIFSYKDERLLADLKTGKKPWDKKRADETGQLSFYLLLAYLNHKIKPEEFKCFIYWLPTMEDENFAIKAKDVPIVAIETKRTTVDILKFAKRIEDTVKAMDEYIKSYPQDKIIT